MELGQCEIQTASSGIWTRVTMSIFYNVLYYERIQDKQDIRGTADEVSTNSEPTCPIHGYTSVGRFGLVSLFNGISTFVGYLMPKPFS